MAWLETLVVLAVIVLVGSAAYTVIRGAGKPRQSAIGTNSRWVATHYAVSGATRVVVRRVRPEVRGGLDEHIIMQIPDSDSDFESKYLEAMAQARARAALFELESE